MKLHYSLLGLLFTLLLFNCKPEIEIPFISKNHLADFQTEKSQLFNLDTISFKKIVGKHGTKINFSRDLLDLKGNEKIQLELTELYDFKEILYRNIQTVTTNNELLETSGVLKIKFTSNGKELQLKKGEKLMIYPPKGKLKDNDIFLSETDSIGSVKWKITNQNYSLFSIHFGGGIWIQTVIDKDSIPFYKKINLKSSGSETFAGLLSEEVIVKDFFILDKIDSNWINIDRFVKNTPRINFKLKDKLNKFSGFDIYIKYQNINSFMYYTKLKNDLSFEQIPINKPTHLIAVGSYKNEIYYDQLELNESLNNSELTLNLKKTSKESLKKLFDK